jgi:hypothetical protein
MSYSDFFSKVETVIEKHSGNRDYELVEFEEENSVILHCGRGLFHRSIADKLYEFDTIIATATWESDDYPLAICLTQKQGENSE